MRYLAASVLMAGYLLVPYPAIAGDPSRPFGEGWKRTIPMPEGLGGEPGQFVVWVEAGWLQVRREAEDGEQDWHVVLARASDPEPPTIIAPEVSKEEIRFEVSYQGGRYFVREELNILRILRE